MSQCTESLREIIAEAKNVENLSNSSYSLNKSSALRLRERAVSGTSELLGGLNNPLYKSGDNKNYTPKIKKQGQSQISSAESQDNGS